MSSSYQASFHQSLLPADCSLMLISCLTLIGHVHLCPWLMLFFSLFFGFTVFAADCYHLMRNCEFSGLIIGFVWICLCLLQVVEVSTSKTGKHGHAKCHFVGIDIFNGKKLEDIVPSSHNCDVWIFQF